MDVKKVNIFCKKSTLKGNIKIPGSKSHTIRAIAIASLANGTSILSEPLQSEDTEASVAGCAALGAEVEQKEQWFVRGFGGKPELNKSEADLMNSGTSTNMFACMAALAPVGKSITFTGDESLRSRPFAPIAKAINDLGGKAKSFDGSGRLPLKVSGKIKGGFTEINGLNSQPVSSLLINCAVAKNDTEISVNNFNEKSYVKMTLKWLDEQGIKYEVSNDWNKLSVKGNQEYASFEKVIPGDFSSATFPLCAAAICQNSDVLLQGLDMNDSQGDKEVVNILKKMGADIKVSGEGIRVFASKLQGADLDLNEMPDALPMLAVVGCFAEGQTRIMNVPAARIKETDRISAMCSELRKMGGDVNEREDGLVIGQSVLHGAELKGYNDHRIVMALAVAGMASDGITTVDSAELTAATFPSFVEKMVALGAKMKKV